MLLIAVGALLVVAGTVLAAVSNIRRGGRLSEPEEPASHRPRDTLEPTGRGRRLTFRPDVPGLVLIGAGVIMMILGAG